MSAADLLSPSRSPTAPLQRYLRWIQVTLYVGSCIFSMISCITLKVTFEDLKDTCPLYAKPAKVELSPSENGSYILRLEGDLKGGEKKTCYYSMYLNIATASYSLVWGALFALLSSPNKARRGHLRRLIFPSLLFNSVLFTSQLISSCVLTLGHRSWCNSIISDLEDTDHVKQLMSRGQFSLTCPLIQSFPWRSTHEDYAYFRSAKFFGLITIAQISSWMVSLTTLVLSMICGERFFKSVWFGEFDGSQDSGVQDIGARDQQLRKSPKPSEAAGGSAPGGQTHNGAVCENSSASACHRKAIAVISCPGVEAPLPSTSSATPVTVVTAAAPTTLELGGDGDTTLLANRSALAGYERSISRQKSSQSCRSGASLASSATPLLMLETPQSPQAMALSQASPADGMQETPLWEPRVPRQQQQAHAPGSSLGSRSQQQPQCRHCNLYTAWRTQY